jgi:hypothetical protein
MALAKESMVMFTDGEIGRDSEVGTTVRCSHFFAVALFGSTPLSHQIAQAGW